jgi:Na+/H+ antiporter NhaD/arsenite permease-like protein
METLIIIVFILGYLIITLESSLQIDKAATALITGILCWTLYIIYFPSNMVNEQLAKHFIDIAGILFFLLGAMTIVELIDMHNGFDFITERINTRNKIKLIWIISIITFFLSAVLDNLTTAIVMISIVRKLIPDKKDLLWYAALIVIASNAGGAWSPIGDVTTTMLWIGNQITTMKIIYRLFLPAIISLIIPTLLISFRLKGNYDKTDSIQISNTNSSIFFFAGAGLLLLVPIFKILTDLPPYMGMLLALGLMWLFTEIYHKRQNAEATNGPVVAQALQKIDIPSILFFMGILLSVSALDATGILNNAAVFMIEKLKNVHFIAIFIGLISSVFDNVPLVAGTMGMFNLHSYPTDHTLWELLAYCAGTGGSILIIGSAAGVAVMGMEKINFFWYLKKISLPALIGYLAGASVYLLQLKLF